MGTTDRDTRRGTILVLEDELALWEIMGAMLANDGYDPEFVVDGAEAVRRYRAALAAGRPYAGVIMDLTVPGGMGARETVKALQDIDPDLRAVISSGYSNDPVVTHYGDYGFRGVLRKPFRLEELRAALAGMRRDRS